MLGVLPATDPGAWFLITGWEADGFLLGETVAFIDGAEGLALMALLDDVLPNAIVCYILRRLFSSVVLLTLAAGWFETIWPYLSL